MKHGNNKIQPDTPYIGIGSVQRVKEEESTRHKWVKGLHVTIEAFAHSDIFIRSIFS